MPPVTESKPHQNSAELRCARPVRSDITRERSSAGIPRGARLCTGPTSLLRYLIVRGASGWTWPFLSQPFRSSLSLRSRPRSVTHSNHMSLTLSGYVDRSGGCIRSRYPTAVDSRSAISGERQREIAAGRWIPLVRDRHRLRVEVIQRELILERSDNRSRVQ